MLPAVRRKFPSKGPGLVCDCDTLEFSVQCYHGVPMQRVDDFSFQLSLVNQESSWHV